MSRVRGKTVVEKTAPWHLTFLELGGELLYMHLVARYSIDPLRVQAFQLNEVDTLFQE